MKGDIRTALIISFFFLAAVYSILPSQSKVSGSHSVYKVRTTPSVGDISFCAKCHPAIAGNVSSSYLYQAHGSFASCICHGFYPNSTSLISPDGKNYNYSINLKHNLTKNVYCTNCHTSYDTTGQIDIGNNSNAINQSGHYIYLNKSDKTEIYDRTLRYFNKSPFGPL